MSRKNVVGNHVHVILFTKREEREREIVQMCLILFSAVNEKTEHNFFYTNTKM